MLEAFWRSVRGEGERERPVPRLRGGVGRPNMSVTVGEGEAAEMGREVEEVAGGPRPASGGDRVGEEGRGL